MQPFDLFKESLVRYRMIPEVAALQDRGRPSPQRAVRRARTRTIIASVAAAMMVAVFPRVLKVH